MPYAEEVSSASHVRVYLGDPHGYLSCSLGKEVLPWPKELVEWMYKTSLS